jgi:hypothetical protein
VNCANIKQKLKKQMRQAIREPKFITMLEIQPFDPFEFKIMQVFYHLLPTDEKYRENLEKLVYANYFFKLDEVQRQRNDELCDIICKKEDINVTIENEQDFDDPPTFNYITKNFLVDDVYVIEQKSVNGCKCKDCSKDSECCPKLMSKPFPYKVDKNGRTVLRLNRSEKILECGDLCLCGPACLNRVSQQAKQFPLCLFKTENRGWGVKPLVNIPKGTSRLSLI